MCNRWVISWLVIDYCRWSTSNRSPKILWPINYSLMTSISHWCNWLLINDISIAHQLLYCAQKTLLLSCTIFFSFVILLSVLDTFFLVSENLEDPALQEKGNELLHQSQIGGRNLRICRKWPLKPCTKTASSHLIEEFAKLNNLDAATVKVWFNNKRQRDTGEPSEL